MTLYSSGSVLDKSSSRVSARSIAMFFNVRFLVLIISEITQGKIFFFSLLFGVIERSLDYFSSFFCSFAIN